MRHDWIFDVLSDLKDYAVQNELPALAAKVEEALILARVEVEAQDDRSPSTGHGGPPSERAH